MKRIIQQVSKKNAAIVQLQSLISRCDNQEETQKSINRIELIQALTRFKEDAPVGPKGTFTNNKEKESVDIYRNNN
jgi:hypothetical protein